MELYWTSKKTISGLKHFVVINQYQLKKEVYLDIVSVLDESINLKISRKDFEESSQWIKGWNDNEEENINIREYLKFKTKTSRDYSSEIILEETSVFHIS